MRFVVRDIHRAFEELDPFTDEQCRCYVRDAYSQFSSTTTGFTFLGIVTSVILTLVSCPFVTELVSFLQDRVWNDPWSPYPLIVGVPFMFAWWLFVGWTAFAFRDLGLRKAIRRRLAGARCSTCSYSLLGLTVTDGSVTCPECGHSENLHARGLSAADILAPEQ
ncbi:MAG: hypothetical protein R3B68_01285 [Phycisphaerales bacterium]